MHTTIGCNCEECDPPLRRRLILMQGKPGCGKSTVANALKHHLINPKYDEAVGSCVVISSDSWLEDDGYYYYTPERQAEAHQWAMHNARKAMAGHVELIIIDNTNLKASWCQFYVNCAIMYGYDIQVVKVDTQWHLQVEQNNRRTEDRRVPIEKYRDMITDDLLYPPLSYSWSVRFWEALRWFRSLFSLKGSTIEITGLRKPTQ